MKLSVKSDYAARAVLALARHFPSGKAQRVESLAEEQHVSPKYLVQILIELKGQRIVKSVRGKEGGYMLARPPEQVSLGDVLRSIHGQLFELPAIEDSQCPDELRAAWKKLQDSVTETADGITFAALLEGGLGKQKMYYI